MKKIVKVAVGIPDKGITDAMAYDNHLEIMHHLGRLQERSHWDDTDTEFLFYLVTIARVFPALARERIVDFAIEESKVDYLFMFDDDMILPIDLFERLYKHNVDICAALAFTRFPPHKPVIYNLVEGYDAIERKSYYINNTVIVYPKDQLVECDAVGFGAVLIKAKLFHTMKKPWFMTTSGAGEDIHFCHLARKAGFHVFMDTSIKLGHLGEPKIVTEADYEADPLLKNIRKTHDDEVKYPKIAG